MVPPLLACLALVLAQDERPDQPTPFDRVVELEITAEYQAAIESHGPTVFAEYEVEFEGALHIWTTSELGRFRS